MTRVLLVDDDADLLASLQELLQQAGFEIIATTSAAEAMRFVEELPPQAAVVDVVMPGSSGFDLMRALRGHPNTAHIPILLISGLASGRDKVRGLAAGADDYLSKPFDPEELTLRLVKLVALYEQKEGQGEKAAEAERALREIERALAEGAPVRGIALGRYQLDTVLGEGGNGVVFRAFDRTLLRPVAIKMFHVTEEGEDPSELRSSLLREAVLAARLSHPHIVAVYDFQETRRAAFIVMELVEGVGLDRYILAKQTLSSEEVITVGWAVSQALACAHNQKIVHRDLKPGNVLIGRDGAIKVSDFGIATFLSSQAKGPGAIFGTPGFLAPECIRGLPYDEKGDLFALGVTLYLCLTGKSPFSVGELVQTLERTLLYDPPPPREVNPAVFEELSHLVMRLLAKDRSKRPSSAGEVASTFERWVRDKKLRWEPDLGALERAAARRGGFFRSTIFSSRGA
ncbi:MAG: protein kinase [Thermoanaerobaculum sp.]|nr:protein kinase [Thermoanaerobaculum sp.]MDW7967322.1 protein kinase [Thermoanaerobaculum sp.]